MFFKKNKEPKYYKIDEIEAGMRVHVRSLDAIYQEAIYLEKRTFKHDSYGGTGIIVAIGLKDTIAKWSAAKIIDTRGFGIICIENYNLRRIALRERDALVAFEKYISI